MEQTQILFSDSNLYFQDTSSLQSNIGFISPMDTDVYVKKSFSLLQEPVNIIGGYIQAFNSSHKVDQSYICYKLNLTTNQPLLKTEGIITFDLEKQGLLNLDMVKNFIQGMPLIAIILLTILTMMAPAPISTVLSYISVIGMIVTVFYYGWKVIKMLYKALKAKGIDYNGVIVYYEKNEDLMNINKEYIDILKELRIMHIKKVVAKNGEFYLQQITRKPSFGDVIKGIFITPPSDDMLAQQLIESTIRFLLQTSFIGSYANKPEMQCMNPSIIDKIKKLVGGKGSVAPSETTPAVVNPLQQQIQNSPGVGIFPTGKTYRNKLNGVYSKYKNIFVEKVFTEVVIPGDDKTSAYIANESYVPQDKRKKMIGTFMLDEKNSGTMHAIYVDEAKNLCIIGYRGTVITDLKDIASDAQIVLDVQGMDPRVKEALTVYDTIKRVYPKHMIRVCGHSLGGTISYIVAKHREPERCIVFNPGVSLNTFFIQMLQDTFQHSTRTQRTYTYKILGDIISAIGFVGHVKTFVVQANEPLALHAMDNFVK